MRAYKYVSDKPTIIKDISPRRPDQYYSPVLHLSKGSVFFVLITKGKSIFLMSNLATEKIQVPLDGVKIFLSEKCVPSKEGTKVLQEAEDLGFSLGKKAYFVTDKDGFEYCDGGSLIFFKDKLCVYTRFNGIVEAKKVKLKASPKLYDADKDLKLFESILKKWDFMSEPSRFKITRIHDRLSLYPNSIALIEKYNQIWNKHEKNPYKSGEYLELIRKSLPKR